MNGKIISIMIFLFFTIYSISSNENIVNKQSTDDISFSFECHNLLPGLSLNENNLNYNINRNNEYYQVDKSMGAGVAAAAILVTFIAIGISALLAAPLVPTIIFSYFYANSIYESGEMKLGMIAPGVFYTILLTAALTTLESVLYVTEKTNYIFGPLYTSISLLILIPSIILSYYFELTRNKQIETGMFWSWITFSSFLVSGIVGMIELIIFAVMNRPSQKKKITFDVSYNQISCCIKL